MLISIRAFNKRHLALKAGAAAEQLALGEALTREEEAARREWEEFLNARNPSPEDLARDAEAWRGSFASVVKARGELVIMFLSIPYFHPLGFDMGGMMFIGMGLMKLGVLSGVYPLRFYLVLLLAGYGLGFSVNSYTAWLVTRSEFDPVVHHFSHLFYQPARLLVAGGHLALLLILCQKGWLRWLTSRLGSAGQMAFTNYVMQSVICAFLFTGYGLGLYGTLERYQLYCVVGAIWVLQLALSPVWLAPPRMGLALSHLLAPPAISPDDTTTPTTPANSGSGMKIPRRSASPRSNALHRPRNNSHVSELLRSCSSRPLCLRAGSESHPAQRRSLRKARCPPG